MSILSGIKRLIVGEAKVLDEAGNVLILHGYSFETISADCGNELEVGNPCKFCSFVCRWLGKFWPNHCQNAWAYEKPRVLAAIKMMNSGA